MTSQARNTSSQDLRQHPKPTGELDTLVVPRAAVDAMSHCQPWETLAHTIHQLHRWMDRTQAEADQNYVQLIPTATIRTPDGRYHVFQRNAQQPRYLQSRLSIVIAGHPEPQDRQGTLCATLNQTIVRELIEEISIRADLPDQPQLAVRYGTTGDAAKHMALVFPITTATPISRVTSTEFNDYAGSPSHLVEPDRLIAGLQTRLDPWSRILTRYLHQPGKPRTSAETTPTKRLTDTPH